MDFSDPTPISELNAVLRELVRGVQAALPGNFVAACLQGSFAVGGWDADSDVDFDVVIEHDLSETELNALQSLHVRLYRLGSPWAQHLEGSYIPRDVLRRAEPLKRELWYLDNTADQLILSDHDNTLVVRWVLREYGIPLAGVHPRELIDFISADELRSEIRSILLDWCEAVFAGQWPMDNRWAQPFAVVSCCRMLQSLETGRVASKLDGVLWAKAALDPRWVGLIQRAWDDRPDPSTKFRQPSDPAEVAETLNLLRYAVERAKIVAC